MQVTIHDLLNECKTQSEWENLVATVVKSADTCEDLTYVINLARRELLNRDKPVSIGGN